MWKLPVWYGFSLAVLLVGMYVMLMIGYDKNPSLALLLGSVLQINALFLLFGLEYNNNNNGHSQNAKVESNKNHDPEQTQRNNNNQQQRHVQLPPLTTVQFNQGIPHSPTSNISDASDRKFNSHDFVELHLDGSAPNSKNNKNNHNHYGSNSSSIRFGWLSRAFSSMSGSLHRGNNAAGALHMLTPPPNDNYQEFGFYIGYYGEKPVLFVYYAVFLVSVTFGSFVGVLKSLQQESLSSSSSSLWIMLYTISSSTLYWKVKWRLVFFLITSGAYLSAALLSYFHRYVLDSMVPLSSTFSCASSSKSKSSSSLKNHRNDTIHNAMDTITITPKQLLLSALCLAVVFAGISIQAWRKQKLANATIRQLFTSPNNSSNNNNNNKGQYRTPYMGEAWVTSYSILYDNKNDMDNDDDKTSSEAVDWCPNPEDSIPVNVSVAWRLNWACPNNNNNNGNNNNDNDDIVQCETIVTTSVSCMYWEEYFSPDYFVFDDQAVYENNKNNNNNYDENYQQQSYYYVDNNNNNNNEKEYSVDDYLLYRYHNFKDGDNNRNYYNMAQGPPSEVYWNHPGEWILASCDGSCQARSGLWVKTNRRQAAGNTHVMFISMGTSLLFVALLLGMLWKEICRYRGKENKDVPNTGGQALLEGVHFT